MSETEFPEQGEIIIATVTKVMDHGAYVTLDEYGGRQGFLHVSEIAPGWIRSVSRYVKENEKKVLLVKRINLQRGDIDLSLKQVSNDQKKKKLLDVKRSEKARTLLDSVKEKAGLGDGAIDGIEEAIYAKYDSVYDAFIDIGRNGDAALEKLGMPAGVIPVIKEVCSKIKLPSVEIRGVLSLTSTQRNGVEVIRKVLLDAMKLQKKVEITYLGAPKYRMTLTSDNFKAAEKEIKPVIEMIRKGMEKKKGTFSFEREESKKTRDN